MRRRALESPKVRPPKCTTLSASPWISRSLLGAPSGPSQGRRLLHSCTGAETTRCRGRQAGCKFTLRIVQQKTLYKKCEALFGIVSLTGKKWAGCLAAPTMESALKASIRRGNLPQASRGGRLLCLTQNSRRNIPEIGNRKKWAAARA